MSLICVWIFLSIGCLVIATGGFIHSLSNRSSKPKIFGVYADFTPFSISLYIIGAVLIFTALIISMCLSLN